MKMHLIIFAALLGACQLAACKEDEPRTPQNGPEEAAYPHRYYIDPENGSYYNTGALPLAGVGEHRPASWNVRGRPGDHDPHQARHGL